MLGGANTVAQRSHSALPPDALARIAGRFKALSEPLRLRLIMALEEGEKNVTQLVAGSGSTQANISRHLQALARAGILTRRKAGNNAYYRIADPAIFALCDHVCGSLRSQLEQEGEASKLFEI